MSDRARVLVPTGTARDALASLRRGLPGARLVPDFPRDLLAGAMSWEEGPAQLHLAWEVARCAPEATPAEHRALVLLGFVALAGIREGSTRMPVRGPLAAKLHREILEPLGARDEDLRAYAALLERPSPRVAPVLGRAGEHRPLILDGDWLATQRMRHFEEKLVEALAARMARPELAGAPAARAAVDDVVRRPAGGIALSNEQKRAVEAALRQPLTVISGGPGTGKTAIVVSILRALGKLGVAPASIALAAPTGKAAHRMDQAVRAQLGQVAAPDALDAALLEPGREAQTLHRLLGYSAASDSFWHHAQNPLAEEVVIVDESSMVDLLLMERLLRSVRPEARLVLLGDAEQLPSVDAGAVFRDLVPTGPAQGSFFFVDDPRRRAAVRLTRSYRMDPADPAGRSVLTSALALNRGELPPIEDGGPLRDGVIRRRARASELEGQGVELVECDPGSAAQRELLDAWQAQLRDARFSAQIRRAYLFGPEGCSPEDRPELDRLFARVEAARLLCVTRADHELSGTGGVNAYFHARELAELRKHDSGFRGEPEFLPGEPLLVRRNDYARGLFNGDQGLLLRGVEAESGRQHFMAVFRRGENFRAFHLDGLRGALELAHAMTVHKAQGSEFERVALILPGRDVPLLTRELLYTGVTRARRSVVLVGRRELLALGASRALGRYSGVAERLQAPATRPRSRRGVP